MSTTRPSVTVHCDGCGATLPTSRTTPAGARGDADRQGWATSRYGDGYHVNKPSNEHQRRDLCPSALVWSGRHLGQTKADVGLFADHNPQEDR